MLTPLSICRVSSTSIAGKKTPAIARSTRAKTRAAKMGKGGQPSMAARKTATVGAAQGMTVHVGPRYWKSEIER
jgi:hypothetical protein